VRNCLDPTAWLDNVFNADHEYGANKCAWPQQALVAHVRNCLLCGICPHDWELICFISIICVFWHLSYNRGL